MLLSPTFESSFDVIYKFVNMELTGQKYLRTARYFTSEHWKSTFQDTAHLLDLTVFYRNSQMNENRTQTRGAANKSVETDSLGIGSWDILKARDTVTK